MQNSFPVSGKLGPNCIGYLLASAPDVELHYTDGSMPLYVTITSGSDTTLVIS